MEMSPGDIALKVWRNRFSKLHLNFSSALPSFTKQIYGPTKNRQALPFLLLFVYMYSVVYSVVGVGEQR
uniref:Uncharacterized protein n=1 Tax=Brassica oleracea var. oleracea TaxID=109376 RepID=A0A0D3BV05_BRAOL